MSQNEVRSRGVVLGPELGRSGVTDHAVGGHRAHERGEQPRGHREGEHRTYMYAHMKNPPAVHPGERIWAGERVGEVGETGNARTVGCQLHIEIHVNGVPIDPKPIVTRWDHET